jgi:hypothetical protein
MTMNSGSMAAGSMGHEIRIGLEVHTSDGDKLGSGNTKEESS